MQTEGSALQPDLKLANGHVVTAAYLVPARDKALPTSRVALAGKTGGRAAKATTDES